MTRVRQAVGAILAALLMVGLAAQEAKRDAADAARLIEVLEIRPGATVADVGAGSGPLVTPIARHLGRAGRLYATDVNADRLAEIRKVIAAASLDNVTVVEGGLAQTNLPDRCCDAIFMRLVYHHFGDPPAMNASLFSALKPGARLAILEFEPTSKTSAPPGKRGDGDSHGVLAATIIEELQAAGFADVREIEWPDVTIAVIARRPEK
jgi:predicted methyltransferase